MKTVLMIKDATIKYATGFANVIMFCMVVLVVAEIIARTVFGGSTMVSTDFVAYGMGIVFYWGACKAMSDGVFVRMDIIYDFYKGKFKKGFDIICDAVLIFFNSDIMYYYLILLQNTFERNLKATNIYETPLWISRLLTFVGMIIFEIYLICRIIEDINSKPQEQSNREVVLKEGVSGDTAI